MKRVAGDDVELKGFDRLDFVEIEIIGYLDVGECGEHLVRQDVPRVTSHVRRGRQTDVVAVCHAIGRQCPNRVAYGVVAVCDLGILDVVALVDPEYNIFQQRKLAAFLEPFIRMSQGGVSADQDSVAQGRMLAPKEADQVGDGIGRLFVAEVVLDDPIDQPPGDP